MSAYHCRKCLRFRTNIEDGVCLFCRRVFVQDEAPAPPPPTPPNQVNVLAETAKNLRSIAALSAQAAPETVTYAELLDLVKDMGKLAGKIADLFDASAQKIAGEN